MHVHFLLRLEIAYEIDMYSYKNIKIECMSFYYIVCTIVRMATPNIDHLPRLVLIVWRIQISF